MRLGSLLLALAPLAPRSPAQEPAPPPSGATSWAHWRGPLQTGVAPDADPPVRWSESENVRWKSALPGKGHSSPIVWGARVFLTTALPVGEPFSPRVDDAPGTHDSIPVTQSQRFEVLAFDRRDGKLLWQTTVHEAIPSEGGHFTGSYASASPTTDGEVLVASFGSHGIHALDLDGRLLWRKDLGRMHTKHAHGEGSSPLLVENRVLVVWDHEGDSFLVALNRRTGEELWRVARDEKTSWASPIAVRQDGKTQVVVSGTNRIRAYDPATGAVLWQCGGLSSNVVCSPVAGGGRLFAGSSYESQALLAIDLARAKGEITDSDAVLWVRRRATPYVPSLLLDGDSLYFLHHYQGFLTRVDARTGVEPKRALRLEGVDDVYASPVAAAGRLYVTDRSGLTVVLRQGEELEIVARNARRLLQRLRRPGRARALPARGALPLLPRGGVTSRPGELWPSSPTSASSMQPEQSCCTSGSPRRVPSVRDAWLKHLFLRFRDRHDGKSLAAVFDATSRELIAVASHLVPTVDLAEDVVQTTFQRAIEHADRYDGERSLKAWLYGILWREAAKLSRVERRSVAPDGLPERAVASPAEAASARELPESVRAALERLASPYREVLRLVLLEERSTREVAAALGRSSGTVRVQLQRGLERLRQELPSAQRRASGNGPLGMLALEPLRARVLRHAGVAPSAIPAASLAFLAIQVASVAVPVSAWLALAVTCATAAIVPQLVEGDLEGEPERTHGASIPVDEEARPVHGGTALAPTREPETAPPSTRTSRRPPPRLPSEGVAPQVRGTVVDERHRRLAGIHVTAEAEKGQELVETTSDASGSFVFGDLEGGQWLLRADDEAYARSGSRGKTVRIGQEGSLVSQERPVEVELVLLPPHGIEGVVVDEEGAPVAGVSLSLAIECLAGSDEPLEEDRMEGVDLATSDEGGGFRFERLPAGRMRVELDREGFVHAVASFYVPGPAPRVVLRRAMALDGTVLVKGVPLVGARVLAHQPLSGGEQEVSTDARGRFRIEPVTPVGEDRLHGAATVVVRVDSRDWRSDSLAVFESPLGTLPTVTLEAFERGTRETRGIEVGRDPETEARSAGVPFGLGRIVLRVVGGQAVETHVSLHGLAPEPDRLFANTRLTSEGSGAFEHLPAGDYWIVPDNRGRSNLAAVTVHLDEGETRVVELRPGAYSISGRVTCDGTPVATGQVVARATRGSMGQNAPVPIERGCYEIAGLPSGDYELVVTDEGAIRQTFEGTIANADAVLDLALASGRIEGRLAFSRADEPADFRVMVFPFGWSQEAGCRGAIVDPDEDGRFDVRHLAPGDYVVSAWRSKGPVSSCVVAISASVPVARVELERPSVVGTLSGRLERLPEDRGHPLFASVFARKPQGVCRVAGAEIESDGEFRVALEPGRYALLVSDYDGRSPDLWVPVIEVSAVERIPLRLDLPPGRAVSIRLDTNGRWTPCAIWWLVLPTGERLNYLHFLGSDSEGRLASSRAFQLPLGTYSLEVDFGDPVPITHSFTLLPGEGVQEIVVQRP